MDVGEPLPCSLQQVMPTVEHEALWTQLATDNQLVENSLSNLVGDSWAFTDASFRGWGTAASGDSTTDPSTAAAPPLAVGVIMSCVKLHTAGFTRVIDSQDCVIRWLKLMQERHILPN